MYNRYIPQPDGSYRRNRVAEPRNHPHTTQPTPPPPEPPPCPQEEPRPQKLPPKRCTNPNHRHRQPQKQELHDVGGFLRRLLPKDFDTADLMIVLLLLLMSGDCVDDQNTALLTLALYFFM